MTTPSVSLGYVLLSVKDVSATLTFYEKAFGLARRVFHEDPVKACGGLEIGSTRLACASLELAKEHLKQEVVTASPGKPPLGSESAMVTPGVPALYARAVKARATAPGEPATKPWGETLAYLRDQDGSVGVGVRGRWHHLPWALHSGLGSELSQDLQRSLAGSRALFGPYGREGTGQPGFRSSGPLELSPADVQVLFETVDLQEVGKFEGADGAAVLADPTLQIADDP